MNVVYVDTSVLVAILLDDSLESARFRKILKEADEVVSSSLIEAEFLSVLSREKLSFSEKTPALQQISLLLPERSLQKELKQILSEVYVRGADAFHLACALYLDPTASELLFLTVDLQQKKAAQQLGFKT